MEGGEGGGVVGIGVVAPTCICFFVAPDGGACWFLSILSLSILFLWLA